MAFHLRTAGILFVAVVLSAAPAMSCCLTGHAAAMDTQSIDEPAKVPNTGHCGGDQPSDPSCPPGCIGCDNCDASVAKKDGAAQTLWTSLQLNDEVLLAWTPPPIPAPMPLMVRHIRPPPAAPPRPETPVHLKQILLI